MTLNLRPQDRPYLPRGVRVQHDKVRNRTVLMAPEKVIELDEIGVAILNRTNGAASLDQIIADLAATYDAPADQIARDVQQFLQTLRSRLYLMVQT